MIVRKGNHPPQSFGKHRRNTATSLTTTLCPHGFPHGTERVTKRTRRDDGTIGFYQTEVESNDSCTH